MLEQSKEEEKEERVHIGFILVNLNLGLHLVFTLKNKISLTQSVHNETSNPWISQYCQFPIGL